MVSISDKRRPLSSTRFGGTCGVKIATGILLILLVAISHNLNEEDTTSYLKGPTTIINNDDCPANGSFDPPGI